MSSVNIGGFMRKIAFSIVTIAFVIGFSALALSCPNNNSDEWVYTSYDPAGNVYTLKVPKDAQAGDSYTLTIRDSAGAEVISSGEIVSSEGGTFTLGKGESTFTVAVGNGAITSITNSIPLDNEDSKAPPSVLAPGEPDDSVVVIDEGVIPYPFPNDPAEIQKFEGVTMTAGGKDIPLYPVKGNQGRTFINTAHTSRLRVAIPVGMFDLKEGTTPKIVINTFGTAINETTSKVVIRPLAKNITSTVTANTITFTLPGPGQYSVEYNNVPSRAGVYTPATAVLIFANKEEDFSAVIASPDTIVIEEGVSERNVSAGPNKTVYLAPGAVLRGSITMQSGSKVVGRGVIDGSIFENWNSGTGSRGGAQIPINTAMGAQNLEIRGIALFDPDGWCMQLQNASGVIIDNVKIISSRCNSDGISIQSTDNVTITNSFIRSWDDGVVLKNYHQRDTHTITVKDTILWTDLAQCMEIGVETNKGRKPDPVIHTVLFENITVFHAMHKAPISIHNGDNCVISGVKWKNIVIENYQSGEGDGWNYLVDLTNLTGQAMGGAASWTAVAARGTISDITIENVKVISGKVPGGRFNSNQPSEPNPGFITATLKDIYNGDTKLTVLGRAPDPEMNATLTWE